MRLSTGIILSILSTNVFAIEHPNGAHAGSLLARRAVVADADGPFLEKRNNDEDQKDQKKRDKSNKYHPFSSQQQKYVHRKIVSDEDSDSDPNPNDDTKESNTDSHTYYSNQNRGATGGRKDVHTDVDLDQEGSSFADASRGSSSHVLGHIRKELYRAKHKVKLVYKLGKIETAYKKVWHHFGGSNGRTIGWNTYKMLEYALKKSQEYKRLYKTPFESPFILKLPSSASDEQRRIYKSLQDEVHKSSRYHISAIMYAIDRIFVRPGSVLSELEDMMMNIDSVYISISNIRSEYPRLLSSLGMSGSGNLANLNAHMTVLRVYRCNLSDRLNIIKGFIKEHSIKPLNQEGSSKFSSSTLGSKRLSEIGIKPSDDGAPSSTQSEDVASSNVQSDVAVVNDLVIL
ncbi:hypothetical protein BASA50_002456 [Batrachochytrium salamandrivorans]|uniref:Uncharacterized protein n=1 Tax=Batrachochytrium salamandrivorans TaxID=1357716 RepID=A0ABQ8FMK3_9FUNG|nr:hypothetical protein BASA62_002496 [Batrachochytrium salamandrivorans]KAH6577846.1 hypothetical protein BASA60_003851 [Batrachochytrium salamandrivorans]KAH6600236.1 hypothetical protein BASA50_002456 [Batrachochytrium salamandrivorans]